MRLCVSEKVSPQAKRARRETERVTVSTFVSESVEKIWRTLCVCVSEASILGEQLGGA